MGRKGERRGEGRGEGREEGEREGGGGYRECRFPESMIYHKEYRGKSSFRSMLYCHRHGDLRQSLNLIVFM